MTVKNIIISSFLATSIGLVSTGYTLKRCSCVGTSSVNEAIEWSDVVVMGKILSKELIKLIRPPEFSAEDSLTSPKIFTPKVAKYTLLVNSGFKGEFKSDTLEIYTGLGGGDCGFRFEIGRIYLVYADQNPYILLSDDWSYPTGKDIYWTNICTRTQIFDENEMKEIKKHIKQD